jgi:hypothetical protein
MNGLMGAWMNVWMNDSGFAIANFLSPLRGLPISAQEPTAYAPSASSGQAVGCNLSPLRG